MVLTNGASKVKAEARSFQIAINIEPEIVTILQNVINEEGLSLSSYGRGLILWDLVERNLITREDIMRICVMGRKAPVNKQQERLPLDLE